MTEQAKGAPTCPHFRKCGGCQLLNLSYEKQLQYKQGQMIRLLGKYAHVENIIGAASPLHYRNKVQAAFGLDNKKQIISGTYQAGSHRLLPVETCLLENEQADEIIATIRKLLKQFHLTPYNEDTGRGFLRHVLVRIGSESGEFLVVLVTGTSEFPGRKAFVQELLNVHPYITTVVQNVNNRHTSMVLGERETVLYGPGKITETLMGLRFTISPKSFYQVNAAQTKVLYETALQFAALTGHETVIDAYCGTGTIGLLASKSAGKVIGVELNNTAVNNARENAKTNGIRNITFVCADAGDFLMDMAANKAHADVVLMDPPRSGSSLPFLKSLIILHPRRIVYISCGPDTLERDLSFLTANGYHVQKIQPVDMFPYAEHVENVCLLTK